MASIFLTASSPWEVGGEAVDEIEERPRDDDAVVDVQKEDDGHGGVADTYKSWLKMLIFYTLKGQLHANPIEAYRARDYLGLFFTVKGIVFRLHFSPS